MDYEYGLRPATNRMAMARGAKYDDVVKGIHSFRI